MATQTLADWQKANPNYKVSYDSAKKMSTVTDPTGKSISFASGQANDAYGITGQIQNGSNVVDANKLMAALQAQANQGQQSQSMQPTQQVQTPSTYQTNASDMIEEQARQQMAAQAAAIQAARDKQVSEYNSQISQAPQTYQPLRNEASYAGAKNLQAANERMAAMGMYNSGDSVTAGIQVNAATQNNINALNLQEQNLVNQLKKAIADANESANSQILQSNSEINAQKLQALINQANADRDFNFQLDQTAYNRGQDALNRTDKVNEVMGYVNPTANETVPDNIRQQLAQYSNNYAAFINSTNDPTLKHYAQVLANEKIFSSPELLAKYGGQFKTAAQRQQDLDNLYRQKTFDYQVSRDAVADTQWQKTFNLDMRQQTFAEAQAKIENGLAQQRINQESASQALQWAKFNADQDPNSLDNQYKRAQIDQLQGKGGLTYKDYVTMGRDMLDKGNYNSDTGTYSRMYNSSDVLAWVRGLPLDATQKAQLANDLGL